MTLQPVAIKRSVFGLLSGTFRSLRHRNYRLFFFGQLISLIGTWLQNTALAWLVWSLTKNAMALGVISFLGSIPVLFLSLYAGTVADEYPKRRILVMTQSSAGLRSLLVALLIWTGNVNIVLLGIAALILGTVNAFDLPTRQAFVVEMASKEDVTNAVALNSSVFNAARLVGPALAGIIIAVLSIATCFFLDGISYIAVIIGLLLMRFDTPQVRKQTRKTTRIGAMKEGVVYLYTVPQFRALMFLVIGMTLFGWSYTVLLPLVAGKILHGGAAQYGALLSANGAGALLAALSQAALAGKLDGRKMLFWGLGVFILALVGISFMRAIVPAVLVMVFVGWGIVTFFITANTTLQRRVPDELRGRVMGIYSLAFAGLFPFGSLLAGWLASNLGAESVFRINSAVLLCFGIPAFLFIRKLPRLTATAEQAVTQLLASEQELFEAEDFQRIALYFREVLPKCSLSFFLAEKSLACRTA